MSLINDALKKAQQRRAEDSVPPSGGTPPVQPSPEPTPDEPRRSPGPVSVSYTAPTSQPPPPQTSAKRVPSAVRYNPNADEDSSSSAENSKGSPFQKIFWITLALIAVAAIGVRLMFTGKSTEASASKVASMPAASAVPQVEPPQLKVSIPLTDLSSQLPPSQKAEPTKMPEAAAPNVSLPTEVKAPQTPEPVAETPPVVTFNVAPAPAPKAAVTVQATPTVAKPAVPASTPEPASKVEPPKAEPQPKPIATAEPPKPAPTVLPPIYSPRAPAPINSNTRIQSFIERLRVTGVRISDSGSKVILNDHLFSVGEIVDSGLELKLVRIEPGVITFTDSAGKRYVKLYQ
ncbi:MAG: hypothetical protein QM790_06645 [Nibricoccus sp.]